MTDIVNPAAPAAVSPLAGKPAPREVLVDLTKLERDYYERRPDTGDPNQLVRFGTSGHRGTSLTGTFTEAHVLAITQAICDYRGDSRHGRTAVSGKGHARAVGTCPDQRPRSAGGQRRGRDHSARQRRDADAGHLARDPRLQSRPRRPLRRRHRHHAVAQSSRGRRLQVQPARRRTGRYRRDALDRGPGQRLAQERQRRGQTGPIGGGVVGRNHAPGRSGAALRPRSGERRGHGGDSIQRPHAGCRSAWWCIAPVLAADQRRLRPEHRRREPAARSDASRS